MENCDSDSGGRSLSGVRLLAAAFKRTIEKQVYWAVFKSGSEQPHISEGALRARKLCGIRRPPRHCLNRSYVKHFIRRRSGLRRVVGH